MTVAAPPHVSASIARINAALEVALEKPPPAAGTLRVCEATEEEWNAFVASEDYVVRPHYLDWFASTGEIHIIEFLSNPHGTYIGEFARRSSFVDSNVSEWLKSYNGASNSQGPRWCPDLSYGPYRTTPGSVLPQGVPSFGDFKTIKIEVGVSQDWGMNEGQLDHKAITKWATVAGVEYILCVKFGADYGNAEYKLYDVRVNPLVQLAPLPIVGPRTEVEFDGHRILGIPPETALPPDFPTTLTVDLYAPLVWARR